MLGREFIIQMYTRQKVAKKTTRLMFILQNVRTIRMDPDVRRNVVTVYVKKNVTMSTEFVIMGVKLVTTILAVKQVL